MGYQLSCLARRLRSAGHDQHELHKTAVRRNFCVERISDGAFCEVILLEIDMLKFRS
jgi:hypothetical protein